MKILSFIFLTFVIVFVYEFFKNDNKKSGKKGEKTVISYLSMLSKDKYIILNDIMLETSYGVTSQIDHVIVSRLGVFPIETKNYAGIIRGDEKDKEWVQDLITHKNSFYNPVMQNLSHVKALKDVLNIKDNSVFRPIVAFSDDCVLDINSSSPVVYFKNLCVTVEDYYSEKLSEEEVSKIVKILNEKNVTSRKKRRKHNKFVAQRRASC